MSVWPDQPAARASPPAPPGGAKAPEGSLLSCYTASIAERLHRRGADWLAVVGLSSVVAVRRQGGLFAFAHHQPSLRPLAAPGLRRTGTADPGAASAGLRAALARAGPVIAVADAGRLPWAPGIRGKRVPHWIVVDEAAGGRWHVTDRFSGAPAEAGHEPWQGWIGEKELLKMLTLPRLAPEQMLRERLAFGDEEPACLDAPYQWYAPRLPHDGRPYLVSAPPIPVSPAAGWLLGAEAVAAVAGHFARAGARADAYRQADDLWVASRHRKLRAIALSRALVPDDPRVAAASALSRAWQRVPMVARYAAEAVMRGRSKAATLVSVLGAVAEAEAADERAQEAEGRLAPRQGAAAPARVAGRGQAGTNGEEADGQSVR